MTMIAEARDKTGNWESLDRRSDSDTQSSKATELASSPLNEARTPRAAKEAHQPPQIPRGTEQASSGSLEHH